MTKRVSYNGIEMSASSYDASAASMLDYLEKVVGRLEDGLDKVDGKFSLSINVDFSPNHPPTSHVSTSGATNARAAERAAQIVERTTEVEKSRVSGSVKVNLQVDDK